MDVSHLNITASWRSPGTGDCGPSFHLTIAFKLRFSQHLEVTHLDPRTACQRSGGSRQRWAQCFRYLIPHQISFVTIHFQSLCALNPSPENLAKNSQVPLPKPGVWAKRREMEGGETVGEMKGAGARCGHREATSAFCSLAIRVQVLLAGRSRSARCTWLPRKGAGKRMRRKNSNVGSLKSGRLYVNGFLL